MNKRMFTIVVALLCGLLLYASFGSFENATNEEKSVLVVGTNAEFPPFTFQENGEIVGFDIDIAKEVGKRLKKEITFKDMPFDALIPDATLGSVDFVAAGLSYTAERAQRVLFTNPYLIEDPLVILSMPSKSAKSIESLADLSDKTVAVNEGFTADLYLTAIKGIKLVRLAATADAFLALKSGRVDAFVTAESTVHAFFDLHDIKLFQIATIPNMSENCAIVVPKQHPELLIQIQHALDEMTQDGTINAIKAKWKL